MKHIITSGIVVILSAIVWLKWGGLSCDLGGLVLLLADIAVISISVGKFREERKGMAR